LFIDYQKFFIVLQRTGAGVFEFVIEPIDTGKKRNSRNCFSMTFKNLILGQSFLLLVRSDAIVANGILSLYPASISYMGSAA